MFGWLFFNGMEWYRNHSNVWLGLFTLGCHTLWILIPFQSSRISYPPTPLSFKLHSIPYSNPNFRKVVKRRTKVVVVVHEGQNWLESSLKSDSSWRLLVGWLSATHSEGGGRRECAAVAACRGEQNDTARWWWWTQWRGCWFFN